MLVLFVIRPVVELGSTEKEFYTILKASFILKKYPNSENGINEASEDEADLNY